MSTEKINWYMIADLYFPNPSEEVLITFVNSAGKHVGIAIYEKDSFVYVAEHESGTYRELYGIVLAWATLPKGV